MLIKFFYNVDEERIREVLNSIRARFNLELMPLRGEYEFINDCNDMDIIGKISEIDGVAEVREFSNMCYPLASREYKSDDTIIDVDGVEIGGKKLVVMAGPCSIDTDDNAYECAEKVQLAGASVFRAGAFKPRTCPYSFQGVGSGGLDLLCDIGTTYQMPVISEIVSVNDLDKFVDDVDIIQVGARNMQNYELLKALGEINKPIMIKRGFGNTIEELLMSAEYILAGGNPDVILCERGIRVAENGSRSTLDLSAVVLLKSMTHLPVLVDPSHGTGSAELVAPLSRASVAVGADGLIIEVHPHKEMALSDREQALTPCEFYDLMTSLERVAKAVDREI